MGSGVGLEQNAVVIVIKPANGHAWVANADSQNVASDARRTHNVKDPLSR